MAARTPRRTFASPFVITLIAAPACYTDTSAPPQQPPPPPAETAQQPPPFAQHQPPMNPPPPSDPQPPPVQQQPPPPRPPVIMNPPRPQPQPAAGTSWTIFKSGNTCTAAVKVTCPQGATCNPPPPQPYACPENVTQYPVVIVSDGTMCQTERAPMHCPPHVACNPPPPKVVPCPK